MLVTVNSTFEGKNKKGNETTLSTTRTQPRDRTVLANQTNKISDMNQTSSMSLRLSVSTTNPNETLSSSRRSASKFISLKKWNSTSRLIFLIYRRQNTYATSSQQHDTSRNATSHVSAFADNGWADKWH